MSMNKAYFSKSAKRQPVKAYEGGIKISGNLSRQQ